MGPDALLRDVMASTLLYMVATPMHLSSALVPLFDLSMAAWTTREARLLMGLSRLRASCGHS